MKNNYAMFTDFYELTMAQGYYSHHKEKEIATFDIFFRKEPFGLGYALMGGISEVIDYIQNFRFEAADIDYLRSLKVFKEDFLTYLQNLRFTGDIYAIPDGTPVFANEPLLTVKAPLIEAQIIETCLLSYLNACICYTTAAKKITGVAGNSGVMEFGARRALGPESAYLASKCAIIGGAVGTSNVFAGKVAGLPVKGTHAHSWIMTFDSEYEAFLAYAQEFPNNCVFLVDTYDVLKSGVPNAIAVIKNYLLPNGYTNYGIRIDSGDLAYLSKEAKKMFEEAGLPDVKICLTNGLTGETIEDLDRQGAIHDSFGAGDNIVLPPEARVGCVYKNSAINGRPTIKISDTIEKITNPGFKKVYRFYDQDTHYALADVLALHDEVLPENTFTLIDPKDELHQKTIEHYQIRELQVPIFQNGVLVYQDPTIFEKQEYCQQEMETLYPEVKRLTKPHRYYVDLTKKLLMLKKELYQQAKQPVQEMPKVKELK